MVYMGTPYIFYIYLITCGWLGGCTGLHLYKAYTGLTRIDDEKCHIKTYAQLETGHH